MRSCNVQGRQGTYATERIRAYDLLDDVQPHLVRTILFCHAIYIGGERILAGFEQVEVGINTCACVSFLQGGTHGGCDENLQNLARSKVKTRCGVIHCPYPGLWKAKELQQSVGDFQRNPAQQVLLLYIFPRGRKLMQALNNSYVALLKAQIFSLSSPIFFPGQVSSSNEGRSFDIIQHLSRLL